MELAEIIEARTATMEEVADAEKELNEAETCAVEAEGEFWEQKKRSDGLSKNIVHSAIKLGEASSHLASMHLKVEAVHQGEVQAVLNAKAEIPELERNQAEIKDPRTKANSQI